MPDTQGEGCSGRRGNGYMELVQLLYFKTTAECMSVTEASRKLFVSQSTITKSLQKLELELGCAVFDRVKNRIVLNENGRVLLESANVILKNVDDLQERISGLQSSSKLRVATTVYTASIYTLPEYLLTHPDVEMTSQYITADQQWNILLSGQVDAVLTSEPPEHPQIVSECWARDWAGVLPANCDEFKGRKSVSIYELEGKVITTCPGHNPLVLLVKQTIEDKGIHVIYQQMHDAACLISNTIRGNPSLSYMDTLGSYYEASNPALHQVRPFIPFDRSERIMLSYYVSFLKENARKVQGFVRWLHESLEEYNETH